MKQARMLTALLLVSAGPFPVFDGTVPVTIRAENPASAQATFAFVKRYHVRP